MKPAGASPSGGGEPEVLVFDGRSVQKFDPKRPNPPPAPRLRQLLSSPSELRETTDREKDEEIQKLFREMARDVEGLGAPSLCFSPLTGTRREHSSTCAAAWRLGTRAQCAHADAAHHIFPSQVPPASTSARAGNWTSAVLSRSVRASPPTFLVLGDAVPTAPGSENSA